jgi:cytochrome b6-f complex iron-sulfur subunit
MTRRGFFSWLGIAWLAFTGASAISLAQLGRFMFPGIVVEPPLSFKAGFPQDYGPGVDERWKEKYGVWIVRDEGEMFALIAICTHLGCPPNWLPAEEKFKCPCHGSGYYISGINFEGPHPRPLERAAISIAEDGQILVDKGRVFQYEKGPVDRSVGVPEGLTSSGDRSR